MLLPIPCSGCGNRHPLCYDGTGKNGTKCFINCTTCGMNTSTHDTYQAALNVWNARADLPVAQLQKQIAGLRYMIDNNLDWKDAFSETIDNTHLH